MTHLPRLFLLLGLAACGDKGETDAPACGEIALTDAGNYSFTGIVDPPGFTTAESVDLEICWPDVTEDIQCHEVDPVEDIDNIGLIRFTHLSQTEVAQGLSDNDIRQADISGYVDHHTEGGETCTTLSQMSFLGTPLAVEEEYNDAGGTYLLLLTTGTSLGTGARMLAFLDPSPGSEVQQVHLEAGCGILDFEVDLASLSPTSLCAEGPWTLDWGGLTVDGHGQPLESGLVDQATLGFYEGMELGALEAGFLDLESLATRSWSAPMGGETSLDLATLADAEGQPFPGFSGDGRWLFALRCSTCPNPAPLYLTLLEPSP